MWGHYSAHFEFQQVILKASLFVSNAYVRSMQTQFKPDRKRVALLDLNETNRDSTKSTLKCQPKEKVNLNVL